MKKIENDECLTSFGEFIKNAREMRGFTQGEMAALLNIKQPYYSKLENGKRNIDLVLAIKICQELKINMKDFIEKYL